MITFKPEVLSQRKEFPTNEISVHEFDVRTDIENAAAVKSLVSQGGPKRLPYAFEDGVVPDGRTGAEA